MQNALTTASQTRVNEWARVNDLLPWDKAPEWARFAVNHCGIWFWLEKPPASVVHDEMMINGKHQQIDPPPRILSTEHLFRRPGPPATPSGITRLLQCNVPIPIAGKAGVESDPERAALLAYADIMEAARARFGVHFEEVVRNAIK